jgi:maleylpyruvate isomerase
MPGWRDSTTRSAAPRSLPVVGDEIALVAAATDRVLATVGAGELEAPSLLPGWTRGHVVTHLARNADSFTWLLDGAAAGEVREQYPGGATTRAAAIDAGAARPTADLRADLERSAQRLAAAMARLEPAAWERPVRVTRGEVPARALVWSRLREVEVHHGDLGLGYGPDAWSEGFVAVELPLRIGDLAPRLPRGTALRVVVAADHGSSWEVGAGPASMAVTGSAADLLGWLLGRDDGRRLQAPVGLPPLGPW